MRYFRLVMVVVLVASLLVVPTNLFAATSASAAGCANDDNWDNGFEGDRRCVNGHMYATRRRLLDIPGCLESPTTLGFVYPSRSYCYKSGGVEAIGQARAIKFLSDRLETPSQGLISPNVQWEMSLSNVRRPDIVAYNRFSAPRAGVRDIAGVHVIEAKVTENNDYTDWAVQVDAQIKFFTDQGMTGVHRGTILNDVSGGLYLDTFLVWDPKSGGCRTASGSAGFALRTYEATSPEPGLLRIGEIKAQRKCSEDKPDEEEGQAEAAEAITLSADGDATVQTPVTTSSYQPSLPDMPECTGTLVPALVAGTTRRTLTVPNPSRNTPIIPEGAEPIIPEGGDALATETAETLATRAGVGVATELGLLSTSLVVVMIDVAIVALVWHAVLCGSSVNGDPHLTTIDGLHYDLQSAGEFVLADSDRLGLHLQGRFAPASATSNVSVLTRAALEINDMRVELSDQGLSIDGKSTAIASGHGIWLGERSYILRDSRGAYLVLLNGLTGPFVTWYRGVLGMWTPRTAGSDLKGLLGNGDGNPQNDLKLADGTQLAATSSATTLHGDFADSWRLTDDNSLFVYADGQSTTTFTDLTFPHNVMTVHDLTADQVTLATAACEAAQVPAGPQFSDCILDVALTANTAFATSAAQVQNITIDPSALTVDAGGNLSATFDGGTIPTNLLPIRSASDPALTAFAGSFSGDESYRFYVQSLPAHQTGTLAFDLIAIGDWTAGTDAKTVTVETDRGSPHVIAPTALMPASSGTLASGPAFATYHIVVPFTQAKSQIEFKIHATGVTGIANQAFGVDNIAMHLDVVPPQVFSTTAPFDIHDADPASGAGNLETPVSEDVYHFPVEAGSGVFVDFLTCPQSRTDLRWEIQSAAGATVASGYNCGDGEARNLAASTYRLHVLAQNDIIGTYSAHVSAIPADVSQIVSIDGDASTPTTTTPGQNAQVVFPGTAGQRVFIRLTDGASTPRSVSLVQPDGSTWQDISSCSNECWFDTRTLPSDGQYTIAIDPSGGGTGPVTVQVTSVPATDATYDIAIDGPAVEASTTPGQNAQLSFTGTAGQTIGVMWSTLNTNEASDFTLRAEDGSVLRTQSTSSSSFHWDRISLPADGTYTLTYDPHGPLSDGTVRVYNAVSTGTTSIDGPSVTAALYPGQVAKYTFTGSAGQTVGFLWSGLDTAAFYSYYLLAPDGSTLKSSEHVYPSSFRWDRVVLPADGTYTLVYDPLGSIGHAMVQIVASTVAGTLAIGGNPATITVPYLGQLARYTFTGVAGQVATFSWSGLDTAAFYSYYLLASNGSTLRSDEHVYPSSFRWDQVTLPTNGTYTLVYDPLGSIGHATVQITSSTVIGTTSVDGPSVTIAVNAGQLAKYTFAGSAGQTVGFLWSGLDTAYFYSYYLLAPDGSTLKSNTHVYPSSFRWDQVTLPTSGTYTLVYDPLGSIGHATVLVVTSTITGTVTVDGTAASITVPYQGQVAKYTFTGSAGQSVGFLWSGLDTTGFYSYYLLGPDGSMIRSSVNTYPGSLRWDQVALPANGTYTVMYDPLGSIGHATIQIVTSTITGTVTVDGSPVAITVPYQGQVAKYTFTGSAGQTVGILWSSLDTAAFYSYYLLNPDGTALRSNTHVYPSSFRWDQVTLPADGTYTVVYDRSAPSATPPWEWSARTWPSASRSAAEPPLSRCRTRVSRQSCPSAAPPARR